MSYSIPDPTEQSNIPYGYCHCGCGELAPIHTKTRTNQGHVKGEPAQYIRGHNARLYDASPPGFKTCAKCKEVKPVSDFYQTKSGPRAGEYHTYCSDCQRADCREYHEINRDRRRADIAEYRRQNKEELSRKERERRADPVYREKRKEALRQWRELNSEHVAIYNRSQQAKARAAVNKAVLRGDLPHATTQVCTLCEEASAKEYHHYAGYEPENWYEVIPLCTVCHGREHRVNE